MKLCLDRVAHQSHNQEQYISNVKEKMQNKKKKGVSRRVEHTTFGEQKQ